MKKQKEKYLMNRQLNYHTNKTMNKAINFNQQLLPWIICQYFSVNWQFLLLTSFLGWCCQQIHTCNNVSMLTAIYLWVYTYLFIMVFTVCHVGWSRNSEGYMFDEENEHN